MAKDKLSLAAWIEESERKGISLRETLIANNANAMGVEPQVLLSKMADMLKVMRASIDYGLTGVRSRSKLTGGSAKKLFEAKQGNNYANILGPTVSDAVIFSLAVADSKCGNGAYCGGHRQLVPVVFCQECFFLCKRIMR
jgi:hypothetical protein